MFCSKPFVGTGNAVYKTLSKFPRPLAEKKTDRLPIPTSTRATSTALSRKYTKAAAVRISNSVGGGTAEPPAAILSQPC